MICYLDLDSTLVDFTSGLESWYHITVKDPTAYDLNQRYGCLLNLYSLPPEFWSGLSWTDWGLELLEYTCGIFTDVRVLTRYISPNCAAGKVAWESPVPLILTPHDKMFAWSTDNILIDDKPGNWSTRQILVPADWNDLSGEPVMASIKEQLYDLQAGLVGA